MQYKGIALLALILCIIAAAGCLSTHQASNTQGASVKEVVYTSESYGKSSPDTRIGYAAMSVTPAPVPAVMQGSGSGTSGMDAKIIKTAYLSIEVKDVSAAIESLRDIAAGKGGYISSTNVQKDSRNRLSGSVVLRVPQAEFDATLTGIKALGTVKSASTQGDDVTEEYVDLVAQKTSYTNQLAQYNAIMKQSTKVEDIIKVQEQIDRVQTQLDRLEGRLKYLNSRVDFSTITVSLQEPEPVGGETGYSFVSTLNEGISGFMGMIAAIIVILLTLLPLIIIGAIGYVVYHWYKGRKPGQGSAAEVKAQ